MLLSIALTVLAYCTATTYAAFGYTTATAAYTIDAGSSNSLVFSVSRTSCDINSILYMGTQLQYSSQGSHIASGLGTATVSITTIGSYIKVTCATSTLTHYLVVKSGDSTIYMATYTTAEPDVGELRFIARLLSTQVPNEYPFGTASNTGGGTAIEGSDVYTVSGQTRSKFYSSERFIDDKVHCVYGDAARVCMVIPDPNSYELSSGGPFMRDINSNNGGTYNALYWYMNSGHVVTEAYRHGLHGPYAMVFSRSGTPSGSLDTSFFSTLSITGYVATSGRGYVSGTASGADTNFPQVLHWYNSAAQYWTYASSSGAFTSPPMKPGTYTMKYYQDEFLVSTSSVSVSAGSTTSKNIASTIAARNTLWKIGDWDGQPTGFRNAANQLRMHPTDSRMSSWSPGTYTIGSSSAGSFPMALVMNTNSPQTISFSLTSSQVGAATLRIGTTLAFSNGRPQVTVNSWTGPAPAAPVKIDSRGLTRGAYRGYGEIYDVSIPAGTLVSGTNTIQIAAISGNTGDGFLAPNFIFDCVELFNSGAVTTTSTTRTSTTTTAAGTTTTTAAGTTTTTSRTSTTTTTTAGGSTCTQALYGQCGGVGFTGCTSCVSGSTCVYSNDYYSQCVTG